MPKRSGNLYNGIADPDNLRLAFCKAARGKQTRDEVILFRADFEKNILKLHLQLQQNRPEIGNYHFFHVRDPKKRLICAASFPERVLHHAIMKVCERVLKRYAIHDSYACRVGKGLRKAVRRCQYFSRKNSWFLKVDIHKYFDSINHEQMLFLLSRRFKDKRLLDLFADLLATYQVKPGTGVPIGNLISQHLANFYLGSLDHWLKEERGIKGYLRYMDDFVIFASSREKVKQEFKAIDNFLENQLHLRPKDDWILNRCECGIPFLGFRILPTTIRLGKRSKQRFVEKFRCYEKRCQQRTWSETELCSHVIPLIEFTRTADAFAFRQNVIKRYGVVS